jgi:hypothetical protein
MGTQRQKTAEGHYLIRVKTEPDRATAPIPVLRQWQNTPGKGHTSETLGPSQVWRSFLVCRRERSNLSADALPMRERRFGEVITVS